MPPAIPDKIPCDTEQQLQRELDDLRIALDQDETEETWEKMLRALTRCKSLVRGGAYRHDSFVPGIKAIGGLLSKPLLSERGRLSAVAIELLSTLASALGRRFEPLMHLFAPALMKLCQRPNKVVLNRTTACLSTIIQHTRVPSILIYLRDAVKDKSVQLRTVASEAVLWCLTHIEVEKIGSRVSDIETIIKVTGRDANPEVRKNARLILKQYQERWPERYTIFISPLSPVSRKYLDVQNVASLPQAAAPAFDLFPSFTKVAPDIRIAPTKVTQAHVTVEKSLPSHGGSSRPPSRTARARVAVEESLPPRPHSVASMGPRQQPIPRGAVGSTASTLKHQVLSRPLSVDLAQLLPKDPPKESQAGSMRIQGGPHHRRELQRHQSREHLVQKPSSAETINQSNRAMTSTDRQRSNSLLNRQEGIEKDVRAPTTGHTANTEPSVKVEGYSRTRTISSTRRPVADFFQPPRPPSRANDSQPFVRPSSRAAANPKDEDANHVPPPRPISVHLPPSRPISVNMDYIAPPQSADGSKTTFPVPQSRTGPETRTPFQSAPKPVSFPSQTPRTVFERPTVVYLPTETAGVVERPRPAKTWSLSHQLELLKKRKQAADQQATEPKEPLEVAFTDTGLINQVEIPASASGGTQEQEIVTLQSPILQPEVPQPTEELANNPNVAPELPIAFPSSEEMKPSPVLAFPTQTKVVDGPDAQTNVVSASSGHKISGDEKPEVPDTTSNPPVRQRVTSTTSVASAPPTRPKMASKASKPPPTRQRVVSTSSNPALPSKEKQALEIPSRGPSRAGNPTGFMPKRTVKDSFSQQTKSQAARVQAVLNEKAATAQATTKAPKIDKAKAVPGSMGPPVGFNTRNTRMAAPISTAVPVSRKGATAVLVDPQNTRNQTKDAKFSNGPTAPSIPASTISTDSAHATTLTDSTNSTTRIRAEPRKPPIPTVSSLVKAHAARREAALASVAAKNGKFSELGGSVMPKIKLAARVPRQPKPIRKIVNPSDRGAGMNGTINKDAQARVNQLDAIHAVTSSSKQPNGRGQIFSTENNKSDEHDEVTHPSSHASPPSQPRPQFQPLLPGKIHTNSGLDLPTGTAVAETTLPISSPSSPLTMTDETARPKFKPMKRVSQPGQQGETYVSPTRAKNPLLLDELRAG